MNSGKSSATKAQESTLFTSFQPNLNDTYRIRFGKEASLIGFKTLIKGGTFHRTPEGFVITKNHKELLDKENIPYELIAN